MEERIVDFALAVIHGMTGWQIMLTICFIAACLTLASPSKIKAGILKILRIKTPGGK